MPNPDHVAMVETALRDRFFSMLPKVETPSRSGWNEQRHDLDRLSRSLAAYALVSLTSIDDEMAALSVTDGENDGGIDAFYFHQEASQLILVQSKFKREGAGPSQEENLKTINGIKALMGRRFTQFNAYFQQRSDEIEEALDTPGVTIDLVNVFLGDGISPHVSADLDALGEELNVFSTRFRWEWCGISRIHNWLLEEKAPSTVDISITLENWAVLGAPRKALYGQINVAELARLVEEKGQALFEKNIRRSLGSVTVNKSIERTMRRHPDQLFYLNNGLTAVAANIVQAGGTAARCTFQLNGVSIVNGAQTAGAAASVALSGAVPPNAKLLFTVIEIGNNQDGIADLITRARNHQTAVRTLDFAALDPTQERLRREFSTGGLTYHYRASAEAKLRHEDNFTLEEAAIALACLSFSILESSPSGGGRRAQHNAVEYVVVAQREVGRLWDEDGPIYKQLFNSSLTGVRLCRLIRIYRFMDQILSGSERSESDSRRRTFFRYGRYFIMAFVAHSASEILRRAEWTLSPEDQALLSRQTNEISELIYAESEPLQAFKGYRAIFRNMTDAQPLADGVLQRLAP